MRVEAASGNGHHVLLILDDIDEVPIVDDDGSSAWSPRECTLTGLMAAADGWIKAD